MNPILREVLPGGEKAWISTFDHVEAVVPSGMNACERFWDFLWEP
jgi:hypothetical protein